MTASARVIKEGLPRAIQNVEGISLLSAESPDPTVINSLPGELY